MKNDCDYNFAFFVRPRTRNNAHVLLFSLISFAKSEETEFLLLFLFRVCVLFNLAAINFRRYATRFSAHIVLKFCKNRKFDFFLHCYDCLAVEIYSDIRHQVWCVNMSCCVRTNIIHLKLEFQECCYYVC